jgi:hypothetical protein
MEIFLLPLVLNVQKVLSLATNTQTTDGLSCLSIGLGIPQVYPYSDLANSSVGERQGVNCAPLLSDGGCGRVIVTRHHHDDLDGHRLQIQVEIAEPSVANMASNL